jgi:hypothetical protein
MKPTKGPWEVRRTIWPYEDGYGTFNRKTNTLLDAGLTKEEAQAACNELNQQQKASKPKKACWRFLKP